VNVGYRFIIIEMLTIDFPTLHKFLTLFSYSGRLSRSPIGISTTEIMVDQSILIISSI